LRPFFAFACACGIRKGQLARTQRRFVDVDRSVMEWPPTECKHKRAHVMPIDEEIAPLVDALLTSPPVHCPYLFHGPHCAPDRKPSKDYGCIGDFKKAWNSACKKAGFPVGRKAGGFVFHHTR